MIAALALATALSMNPILQTDKAAHFGLSAVGMQVCVKSLSALRKTETLDVTNAFICHLIMFAGGLTKEFAIDKFPDGYDMLANQAGIVTGVMLMVEW